MRYKISIRQAASVATDQPNKRIKFLNKSYKVAAFMYRFVKLYLTI